MPIKTSTTHISKYINLLIAFSGESKVIYKPKFLSEIALKGSNRKMLQSDFSAFDDFSRSGIEKPKALNAKISLDTENCSHFRVELQNGIRMCERSTGSIRKKLR